MIIGLLDANRRHRPSARDRFDVEAMLMRAVDGIEPAVGERTERATITDQNAGDHRPERARSPA